jgi:phosphoribosylformylglycinamidine cyclo-ligase
MSSKKKGLSYKEAGVDIDAASEALGQVKTLVQRTFDDNVLKNIGSFGAMYNFDPSGMDEPVLVSSVDGVGTKLKLAFMTGKHDTIGIDLVSHCVNDILVQGARPIFFLDYLACGKLRPEVVVEVIKGLATGCRYAGCALIGGETAEMPDMYADDEYDVAGTIVGVVDRSKIVDGSSIQEGDVIIGLESSGLHTNGYSLARKIFFERAGLTCDSPLPGTDRNVGEVLLEPHRSYARVVSIIMRIVNIKGMSHITGGGITDNLPRTLPDGHGAVIDLSTWAIPPIFSFMKEAGGVEDDDMLRTFNMGIGYIIVVRKEDEEQTLESLRMACEEPRVIGHVTKGNETIEYKGSPRYASSN